MLNDFVLWKSSNFHKHVTNDFAASTSRSSKYHNNFLISLIEVICKTARLLSLPTIRLINYHLDGFRSAISVRFFFLNLRAL